MAKFLVVYSIGPVQSFIATARKTEDLWSGSYLLSELVEQAMEYTEEIIGADNVEWIQPYRNEMPVGIDMASNPNRFLFLADTDTADRLKTQLNQLSEKVRQYLTELTKRAVRRMYNYKQLTAELEAQVDIQMDDFLELFWSFQPYDKEKDDFDKVRNKNEKNLASVKNNRLSKVQVQEGLACSVCRNENVLSSKMPTKEQSFSELKKSSDLLWKHIESKTSKESNEKIKKGERLCSICILKRMLRKLPEYKEFCPFPSVEFFSQYGDKENNEKRLNLERDDKGKYYAMVMYDGDDMGKWVSNKMGEEKGPATIESLKNITCRLSWFSTEGISEALKVAEKDSVKVIYSGGDDVLALGTTKDLIRFVSQLRKNFATADKGLDPLATASCGIVIAPEKEPLQKVVSYARKAESKSKNYHSKELNFSKNAFTIHFVSNAGKQKLITLPFNMTKKYELPKNLKFSGGEDLLSWLLEMSQTMKDIGLSQSFTYQFEHVFKPLSLSVKGGRLPFQDKEYIDVIRSEFSRIIYHSSVDIRHSNTIDELINDLTSIYYLYEDDFTSYIHLLEIIQYLSRDKEEKNV